MIAPFFIFSVTGSVGRAFTRTPWADSPISSEAVAKGIAQVHAIPRLADTEGIAAAALLLGPDSGRITGQVVPVDRGRLPVRAKV